MYFFYLKYQCLTYYRKSYKTLRILFNKSCLTFFFLNRERTFTEMISYKIVENSNFNERFWKNLAIQTTGRLHIFVIARWADYKHCNCPPSRLQKNCLIFSIKVYDYINSSIHTNNN